MNKYDDIEKEINKIKKEEIEIKEKEDMMNLRKVLFETSDKLIKNEENGNININYSFEGELSNSRLNNFEEWKNDLVKKIGHECIKISHKETDSKKNPTYTKRNFIKYSFRCWNPKTSIMSNYYIDNLCCSKTHSHGYCDNEYHSS